MSLRILVYTKAATFQERKQQHIQLGYRIEDERPIPVNGWCSFVAVRGESRVDAFNFAEE